MVIVRKRHSEDYLIIKNTEEHHFGPRMFAYAFDDEDAARQQMKDWGIDEGSGRDRLEIIPSP